jgi:hypothetical protein
MEKSNEEGRESTALGHQAINLFFLMEADCQIEYGKLRALSARPSTLRRSAVEFFYCIGLNTPWVEEGFASFSHGLSVGVI